MNNVKIDFDTSGFVNESSELIDAASIDFATNIGVVVKQEIMAHIPPPASAWGTGQQGMLATGDLKSSIEYEVTKANDSVHLEVGPAGGQEIQAKAHVHAYGKTIRPKKKPYMQFLTPNGWVTLHGFTIKPKGFMLTGWSRMRLEIARYR